MNRTLAPFRAALGLLQSTAYHYYFEKQVTFPQFFDDKYSTVFSSWFISHYHTQDVLFWRSLFHNVVFSHLFKLPQYVLVHQWHLSLHHLYHSHQ